MAAPVKRAASATAPGLAGEADGLLGGPEQRLRLVDALGLLALGHAVINDAGARLDVPAAVLHEGGAQDDAGVHLTVRAEIADGAGIEAALVLLQLVDDLHRPDLRRTRDRAGGKARSQRIEGVMAGPDLSLDVGDDMHHMAVALDEKLVRDAHRPDGSDTADIVAAEVEQHEVLGDLLGVFEQRRLMGEVLRMRLAAR